MEWLGYGIWALIPIAGVIAWGAIGVAKALKGDGAAKEDLDRISQRLDAIDGRLAVVEKAINDIP